MNWRLAILMGLCAQLLGCASQEAASDLEPALIIEPGCLSASECGPGQACEAGECLVIASQRVDPSTPNQSPFNQAPTVTLISPSEGALFMEGESLELIAEVGDDGALSELKVTWLSNRGGEIGQATVDATGRSVLKVSTLVSGKHDLEVRVSDAEEIWQKANTSIVIDGRPTRPVISLLPKKPTVADDLVVTLVHDAKDENRASSRLAYRYRWFADDEERPELQGKVVPSTATLRGQTWSVQVAASDPYGFGGTSVAEVTINNAPPSCLNTSLLPPMADTTTAMTCLCSEREELDKGDKTLDRCAFYDEDTLIAEVEGENGACVLPADATERGMKISCALTPMDESDAGKTLASATILVDNAHPTRPEAALSPQSGALNDGFSCEITKESSDADGDALSYEVAWFVNGYPNAPPYPGPVSPIDLVRDGEGEPAKGGDTLHCEVFARDVVGEVSLAGAAEPIIIDNTAPSGGSCALTPSEGATATSVLTCSPSGAIDIDGDPIDWTYAWTVTGPGPDPESSGGALTEITTYPPVTGPKLAGFHFQRDALVSCVATPNDGMDEGDPITCGEPVLIENSLPTIWEVLLDPPGDTPMSQPVTCTYSGWSDADEIDIVEVRYSWLQILETEVSIAEEESEGFGATLVPSEAGLSPGDIITCIARPFNGPDEGEGTYATYTTTIVADP